MKSKLDRVQEAVRHLKGQGIISTQQDIAIKMSYGKSSVSLALNGNEKYFTDSFIKSFNKAFNNIFNLEYLIDGEGAMLMEVENRFDSNIRFLTLYESLKRKSEINSESEFSKVYNLDLKVLISILNGEETIKECDIAGASENLSKFKDWIFTGENSPFVTGELEFNDNREATVMHTPSGMVMMHSNAWKKIQQSLNEYKEYLDGLNNTATNDDRSSDIIESQQRTIEELTSIIKVLTSK